MWTTRYVQRLLVVFITITCTTLLYLRESSSSFQSHPLPQSIGGTHRDPGNDAGGATRRRGNAVKPLAYIFPQYYTFPDNDRLHGKNFTEWVNVKKVTKNRFGLETIRPHDSIGFYNGLELETRRRYGDFLKEYGFYGAVFHHYWFAGRPVMEHVIEEMLKDGEPNVPFMLSWANEPWSARWDGKDGTDVLIGQEYGLHQAWRDHFDWLLPFFRHPQYIRSEGRIQFIVYNPQHVGHLGPLMWAAFRQWAVEEGLGGMDIIETRWGDDGASAWRSHPPDAVNEFHPHVAGNDFARYPATRRLSRVYHRGTLACWDTTPRHPKDGKAVAEPFCHPKRWKWHLVEMLQKIKSDPNPIGAENFLFVNALNEWGEGNAIEPSAQFGDGYGVAMREAMEISEREHVWFDVHTENAIARNNEVRAMINQTADVCVLVRTSPDNADDKEFKLSAMLRSLVAQRNQRWRAVVFQADNSTFKSLDQVVVQTLDHRIRLLKAPINATYLEAGDGGNLATDSFIKNMTDVDPWCATARYMLIAEGGNIYEPHAFDSINKAEADIVGLNVESVQTIWDHEQLQDVSWEDSCTRLENRTFGFWNASIPTLTNFDLSASFFNLSKFLSDGHEFSRFTATHPGQEGAALAEFLTTHRSWTYEAPEDKSCHVYHNPSYTTCLQSGNFWFDSPIFSEQGCYTSQRFFDVFEKKSPKLKDFDLQFFRGNGFCVPYKEKSYYEALEPKVEPPLEEDEEKEKEKETDPSSAIIGDGSEPAQITIHTSSITAPATAAEETATAAREFEHEDDSEFHPGVVGKPAQTQTLTAPEESPLTTLRMGDDPEPHHEFHPGAVSSTIPVSTVTPAALPAATGPSLAGGGL